MANLDNVAIATYALYRVGGVGRLAHTEDVAMECWRLTPPRFSWTRYPQYPNVKPASDALSDAKKVKNGHLVEGTPRGGWRLTPAGADWVRRNEKRLSKMLAKASPIDSQHRESAQVLHGIRSSRAFRIYAERGDLGAVPAYQFAEMLQCNIDSGADVFGSRLAEIKSHATLLDDSQILEFVQACEERLRELLGSS